MRTQLNNGREYELEDQYGLPEKLPKNESILWQGSPNMWKVAKNIFYLRLIVGYFACLIVYRIYDCISLGQTMPSVLMAGLWMLALSVACVGMVVYLAYLTASTTVYTITNRRVVMRIGIALTKTFNLPYKAITAADVHQDSDGHGDIPLKITLDTKIAYVHLWPHTRPRVYNHPQPMLRCIADVAAVSTLLTNAWCAENNARAQPVARDVPAEESPLTEAQMGSQRTHNLRLT